MTLFQRPGSVLHVVALDAQPALGGLVDIHLHLLVGEQLSDRGQLYVHDPRHDVGCERPEGDEVVEAVDELGREVRAGCLSHQSLQSLHVGGVVRRLQQRRAQITTQQQRTRNVEMEVEQRKRTGQRDSQQRTGRTLQGRQRAEEKEGEGRKTVERDVWRQSSAACCVGVCWLCTGHEHDGVAEVHLAPLPVSQMPLVEHLQEDVAHLPVGWTHTREGGAEQQREDR